MKKMFIRITAIALLILCMTPAVQANSVTYKISVTIPVIPGFNAPPFPESQSVGSKEQGSNLETVTVREEVWRGQQKIILETIVAD